MVNNSLETDTSPAFDFRSTGLDFASQEENWSDCEEMCFLLSSVPELTYISLKLRIWTK